MSNIFNAQEILQHGTSISYKTLQSIFNRDYRIKYPIDPRTLNTLTKLVRFTGYNNWNEFIEEVDRTVDADLFDQEDKIDLIAFVRNALRYSFDAIYKQSSNGPLHTYFDTKQSAFKVLEEVIVHNRTQQNTIANPYNPSTYEIMDIKIEAMNEKEAKIKTTEYWLLCWWSQKEEKYVRRLKDINDHHYVLRKSKRGWKIRSDITLGDKY